MLGVRLDPETERSLEALARRTRRPKSQIAREAIRAYVQRQDVELAREQWRIICEVERNNPDSVSMLDGMASDLTRDL